MNHLLNFFQQHPWKWGQFISMLLVIFVVVPITLEGWLATYLLDQLGSPLYAGTATGLVMALVFMVSLYIIALRPKHLSWKEVGICSFPSSYFTAILGWTLFSIVGSVAVVIFMEIVLGVGPENHKSDSLQSQMTLISVVIAFTSAAIISPIYEEILYRGFIYRFLRVKTNVPVSLFLSSLIFMLVHIPTYNTLPVNFLGGLVFAWTYEKTGSILPAILIHSVFNGLAVLLTAMG